MKLINLVAASVLAATASVAMADNTGFYAGVLAGYGKVNYTSDYGAVKKNHGFDGGINAGYMFNNNFGVEAGYMQYSNVKGNTFADADLGTNVTPNATENYSLHLAGVAKYDLTSEFNVFGKLGVADVHTKETVNGTVLGLDISNSETESRLALFAGAGVGYDVTQNVEVSFETDYTTKSDDIPAMYSANVGVAYKF